MKREKLMYVVNLVFKGDRGIVNKCVIFKDIEQRGQEAIDDRNEIEELINSGEYFMFQNSCVNGKTHIGLLEDYHIYNVNEMEFSEL